MALNKVKKGLLFFISVLLSLSTFSQVVEKEYNSFNPVITTPITLNDLNTLTNGVTVYDSEAGFSNQKNSNPYSYISMSINSDNAPYEWYEVKVQFEITPLLADGTPDSPFIKEFIVSYNPNGTSSGSGTNFSDLNYLQIKNRYGLKVKVVPNSIEVKNIATGLPMPTLPSGNVFVNLGFKVNRYYSVSEQIITPSLIVNTNNSISINWNTFQGAIEYELEWTWIDGYADDDLNGVRLGNQIDFSERDFELNNTRIITTKNNYEIPLIYSKGYLIYRVRPVGRLETDINSKFYGIWSSGTNTKLKVSDWPHQYFITAEHEKDKNWQFQASYAEEGKKKEVVSYFDGSLRNRQTVTKVNTDNNAVIGEVIYDSQGRAAIEVLPTPVIDNTIRYFKNFNLNVNGSAFSFKDFDLDNPSNTSNACATSLLGMSSTSGSSRYYSPAGFPDFSLKTNQAFVPDAKLFPFSQIEYTPDNTGRITRKGGVGYSHQLDSSHEMKYFYATPYDVELNRLFGYSVGNVSHYKKNIVVDPNGQVSVSYLDPQGRTIATALAGGKPSINSLDALEDEANNALHGNLDVELLKDSNTLQFSGNFPINYDKWFVSKQIGVAGNSVPYNFKYSAKQTNTFSLDCPGVYPFVYDLNLSLKDQCGTKLFEEIKKIGPSSVSDTTPFPFQFQIPTTLNTGTYSLTKELKVNEEALNTFADDYILKLKTNGSGCYVDPIGFSPNVSLDICNLTCEPCLAEIGTLNSYVEKALKNYYNNDSFVATLTSTGITVTVNYTNSNTDLNGILPLEQAEVDAFVVRFTREWQLLSKECDKICNPTVINFETTCMMNENMLLGDLRPNGQYGATNAILYNEQNEEILDSNGNPTPNPNFDKLSVFNSQGGLFYYNPTTNASTITGNNWKNPIGDYRDEEGNLSLIQVTPVEGTSPLQYTPKIDIGVIPTSTTAPDGSQILNVQPEQLLNVKDFIAKWDDNWANNLIQYHPEYQYLLYSRDLCSRTIDFPISKKVNGIPTTINIPLSSDGYDSYISNTNTYQEAKDKGFIDFESGAGDVGKLKIYTSDPYFKAVQSQFEDATLYGIRTGNGSIMYTAITQSYLSDTNATNNLTMFQVALKGVRCNPFSTCNVPHNSTLNESEKDEMWRIYRSLYLGLKTKIKHVFINIHAKKKKSYNGCIGTSGSSVVTDVLSNNFPQKAILYNYIQNNTSASGSLCDTASGTLYQTKQKLFLPADFAYNSNVDPNQTVNSLVQANHFEYYAQTGNCPMLLDFDILLNGFFKDTRFTTPKTSLSNVPFNRQYITRELMKKIMIPAAGQTVDGLFQAGLNPLTITTTVTGSTLNINFNPSPSGGFTTHPITVQLPTTGSYTWSNYDNTWKIINLKQFYYDLVNSNPAAGIFKYKVVAEIGGAINNPTNIVTDEILLSGETHAPIGACGISPNSIGEVLDPNQATNDQGVGCNKKYKFEKALVAFLNELKVPSTQHPTAMLHNTTGVNLNTYLSYKNSFLAEFFNENITIPLNTIWIRNGNDFSLKRGTETLATFSLALPQSFVRFENASISNSTTTNTLILSYRADNGTITSLEGTITPKLNFDCCSIIDPWANDMDHDGVMDNLDNCPTTPNTDQADLDHDGIGNVCDATCNNDRDCDGVLDNVDNCPDNYNPNQSDIDDDGFGDVCEPVTCEDLVSQVDKYELNLKNLINNAIANNLLNGNYYLTSSNSSLSHFIQDSELIEHFQALRDYTRGSNDFQTPITLDKYMFSPYNGNPILSLFMTNLSGEQQSWIWITFSSFSVFQSISEILNIDYINSQSNVAIVRYIDNNNQTKEDTVTILNSNAITQSIGRASNSICSFLGNQSATGLSSRIIVEVEQNNNNLIARVVENNPQDCSICIPQTIESVPCTAAKNAFITAMAGITIPGYTVPQSTLDNFCDSNYQYISDSYIYYLTQLGVNQLYDIRFKTLTEFGDTYLHYGFNGIRSVIDQYKIYYTANATNPDVLDWNQWVETVFRPDNIGKICPPAALPMVSDPLPIDDDPNCEHMITNLNEAYSQENYNNFLQTKRKEFIAKYIQKAMSTVEETLDLNYYNKEYQYTLYYYDQSGNLTQTVAPEGIDRLGGPTFNAKNTLINDFRNGLPGANSLTSENIDLLPQHTFKTQYKYNSLNQLVWQSTPDGGETRFAYDKLGRIIASQNANQDNAVVENINYAFGGNLSFDNGGNIQNGGTTVGWINNNYGYSTTTIAQDGYVERTVSSNPRENIFTIFGMAESDNLTMSQVYERTRYGFYIYDNQQLLTITTNPDGTQGFGYPNYYVKAGDKLKVERKNGSYNYYVNNNLIASITDYFTNNAAVVNFSLLYDQTKIVKPVVVNYSQNEAFSYTKYDELGRINEVGQLHVPVAQNYTITNEGRILKEGDSNPIDNFEDGLAKTEVTKTIYDVDTEIENGVFASQLFNSTTDQSLFNNRNRVTAVLYYENYDSGNPLAFNNAILYNYDVHGNVKEQVTYYSPLRDYNCTNSPLGTDTNGNTILNDCEVHLKRVEYDYDLISGNVNSVTFQKGKLDQFIHKYEYDADNRIVNVQTSKNGLIWEKDASYQYYPHGPLSRVELGNKKVQGLDYAYTLQGWLKGVNGENLMSPENDMNKDGNATSTTKTNDAFGYSLNYYDGDYQAISPTDAAKPFMFSKNNAVGGSIKNLYNGNIKQMTTAIRTGGNNLLDVQKNNYTYDQLNRIKAMSSIAIKPNESGYTATKNSYSSSYSYDRNGNLQTLNRYAPNELGNPILMDNLRYDYLKGDNKLRLVEDNAGNSTVFNNDLESQIAQLAAIGINYNKADLNSHNYVYDEIGQLIEDKTEKIKIEWRVDGKVKGVLKDNLAFSSTYFEYDGLGNRIAKTNTLPGDRTQLTKTTLYSRDAQGNVLGVYDLNTTTNRNGITKSFVLKENHLYGSSRLGIEENNIELYHKTPSNLVILQAKTANLSAATQNSITASYVEAYKDFALQFNSTTFANWPINHTGVIPANPTLDKFALNTKYKFLAPLTDGNYTLGQFVYQGQEIAEPTQIQVALDQFTYSTADCVVNNSIAIDNSTTLAKDYFGVLLDLNGRIEAPIEENPVTDPTTNLCFPPIDGSMQNVLAANELGYVNYKYKNAHYSNKTEVGFEINTAKYGFRFNTLTAKFEALYNGNVFSINDVTVPLLATFGLKVERKENEVKYYIDNVLKYTASISGIAAPTANLYVHLPEGNSRISGLKVMKYEPAGSSNVTTQMTVNVTKTGNLYKPSVVVNQVKETASGDKTKRNIVFEHNNTGILDTEVHANGIEINLDAVLNGYYDSKLSINGVQELYQTVLSYGIAQPTSSVPVVINQIGGSIDGGLPAAFNMCYLNYQLGQNNGNLLGYSFTFDDVISDTNTTNAPKDLLGNVQMNLSPVGAVRVLGPCLTDTDADGIYDIYENLNANTGNTNLSDDDTDGDLTPNYLDNDDDGDGIYTINEGSNLDGNKEPADALNTDGDGLKNYLDVDDDNDGYATWETYEGGHGTLSHPDALGVVYTADSDNDGIYNYLDATNGVFPVTGPMTTHYFTSLVGDKRYELSNHLGNVLSVISDRKIYNSEASSIVHFTNFANTATPWEKSANTQSMTVETERLKVITGRDLNGVNGYYTLEQGKTYHIGIDVDTSTFTAPLEFSLWKGNDKLQGKMVTSGTVTTTITPAVTATYRFNFRMRQNNYTGAVQTFFIDNVKIYDATPTNGALALGVFNPDVVSYSDYYPFGSLVPNRHGSSTAYRYGFQGQEKDDELKGEGNSLNYTFRMHDPRVGRFFAVDPLTHKYPYYSPYQFSGNRLIDMVELEGLEPASTQERQNPPDGMATDYNTGELVATPQLNEVVVTNNVDNKLEQIAMNVSQSLKEISNNTLVDYSSYKGKYGNKYHSINTDPKYMGVDAALLAPFAIVGAPIVAAEAGVGTLITTGYESYSSWYTGTWMSSQFTLNSAKAAVLGFATTSGGQYLASGFDINSVTVGKNAMTSPFGGVGGLIFKSSFQQDKTTGNFKFSSPSEFALDFSFGKMSDSFGGQIKSFKLPQFSAGIGTYMENVLIMGSKGVTNTLKDEVKKESTK